MCNRMLIFYGPIIIGNNFVTPRRLQNDERNSKNQMFHSRNMFGTLSIDSRHYEVLSSDLRRNGRILHINLHWGLLTCIVRCVACGVQSVVCEVQSVVCDVWSVVCDVQSVVCDVWRVLMCNGVQWCVWCKVVCGDMQSEACVL